MGHTWTPNCPTCFSPIPTSQLNKAAGRKVSGFTLIEIMLALGMLSLIMAALYGSYQAVTGSIERVMPGLRTSRSAVLTLNQMCRQLRGTYASRSSGTLRGDIRQAVPADQDKPEGLLTFSGESDDSGSKLSFVTSQGRSRLTSRHGQLWQVRYAWKRSEGRLLMARRLDADREFQDEKELVWRCLHDSVLGLELEFYDGEDWHSAWEEDEETVLPHAVRIRLVVGPEDSSAIEVSSMVSIVCRGETRGTIGGADHPLRPGRVDRPREGGSL